FSTRNPRAARPIRRASRRGSRLGAALAMVIAIGGANAAASPVVEKFPKLAPTPPMGWNSWNRYGCDVDEAKVRTAAQALVSSGMRDAGYRYVVIDDCWQGTRNQSGTIRPDPKRFPSGIKALADFVHGLGLKF